MSDPSSTDPLIGRTVAQYEILGKLGGGAMGVVYKARDMRLGRLVALKFLPPQWSHDESAKQRFVREAQAASATNHRNICVIHNIEETDDGRLFIVMAHYEGQTLKQRLERGPLPIDEAIEIGSEIAEGLARAHGQGVVHRDIKPGNLMLTDDGVKILDFGLAKFADALQLTIAGSSIGTAAYMSPEQARGEEADARSDVWALGVVLFEMLTGRLPFSGAYVEATLHAIKTEPLPSLRALRPDVPEALERLVTRALDKDPALRFENARVPARDLRFLAGRSMPLELRTEVVPAPESRAPGAKRSSRAVVGAVALVMMLAAGGAAWWFAGPVSRTTVAVVPIANNSGLPELDAYVPALTLSLIDEISDAPGLRVVPYVRLLEATRPFMGGSAAAAASTAAIQAIREETGAPFLVVPTLLYRDRDATWVIAVQIRNAQTGTAVRVFETPPVTSSLSEQTAFRLLEPAAAAVLQHFRVRGRGLGERPSGARFHAPAAAQLFTRGLDAYERLEYAAALTAFTESATLDSQQFMTQAWLARTLLILSRKNDALAAAQRARSLIPSDAAPRDRAFVDAILAECEGNADRTEAAYRRLADTDPEDAWGVVELADYLKRRQDANQRAVDAYHRALALDGRYIRPHVDLCQLYTRLDDHPMAEKEAEQAIDRYRARKLTGGEAQALLCRGEAQREQGGAQLERAEASIRQALDRIDRNASPYSYSRALFYQALVAYSAERFETAARLFEAAATGTRAVGNRVTEGLASMNLGVINTLIGRPTRASAFYQESRAAFLAIADERRVAEVDSNSAALDVDFGIDLPGISRRLGNARTNFERLGHIDFQLAAMESESRAYRHLGALDRSRTVGRAALNLALSRDLTARARSLTLALAQTDIQAGAYAAALAAIEPIAGRDKGRDQLHASVTHAVVLTRLGRFDEAETVLTTVVDDLQAQDRLDLLPEVQVGLGDLAYERDNLAQARAHYAAAISSWSDPLPNPASVEARCRRALLSPGTPARDLEAALADANRTGRLTVIAECRMNLARAYLRAKRSDEALRALSAIDDDTAESTLGLELRARVERTRSEALTAQGSPEAPERLAAARASITAMIDALPPEAREKVNARREISAILQHPLATGP